MPFWKRQRRKDISQQRMSQDKTPSKNDSPIILQNWGNPFEVLRKKWHEVPAGQDRVSTKQLLTMSDAQLLELWLRIRKDATQGPAFAGRGWYHILYKDNLKGKRVLDVGSGLGIDGITFAQNGAEMTFLDIAETNLEVLKRICRLLDINNVTFAYLESLNSLEQLRADFDFIWCQGSMINAPFDVMREECNALLTLLPPGGRWIELCYPRERWINEGQLPPERWGDKTDGGAPWIEWYDLEKLKARLHPAQFDVVMSFNFHKDEFNWFDLLRIG